MRRLAVLFAFLLAAVPGAARAESSATEAFLHGNDLYRQGDFAGAAAAYEGVIASGITSPELEYNLGNAYLKAGKLAPAILHYRRAIKMRPRYESALLNLNYARSLTQDVKPDDQSTDRMAWIGRLRLGPGRAAGLCVLAVAGFLILAALRLRWLATRPWVGVLQAVLGVVALLLAGAVLFEWSEYHGHPEGVVAPAEVEVRAGPGTTYTVSFRLHEGAEVELLRQSAGWREIKVSDRLQGWVPQKDVDAI